MARFFSDLTAGLASLRDILPPAALSMARRRRALEDDDPQDLRRYMQQLQITLKKVVARLLLGSCWTMI